jgi:hypothetical protein
MKTKVFNWKLAKTDPTIVNPDYIYSIVFYRPLCSEHLFYNWLSGPQYLSLYKYLGVQK